MKQNPQDLQVLQDSINDLNWFKKNIQELSDKFEGQFIAIKNKDVVGFAPNVNILLGSLKRKGVDESFVLIKKVTPRGEVTIF